MSRFNFIAAIAACLLLASCGNIADQVAVNGYSLEKVKDLGMDGSQLSFVTNLVLDAENESCSNIEFKKGSAVLYNRRGHKIATATTVDERRHVLHRKKSEEVKIPVRIEFENAIAALSLANLNVDKIEGKEYTIDYDCVVKAGPASKRFKKKGVPVAELLEKLQK